MTDMTEKMQVSEIRMKHTEILIREMKRLANKTPMRGRKAVWRMGAIIERLDEAEGEVRRMMEEWGEEKIKKALEEEKEP